MPVIPNTLIEIVLSPVDAEVDCFLVHWTHAHFLHLHGALFSSKGNFVLSTDFDDGLLGQVVHWHCLQMHGSKAVEGAIKTRLGFVILRVFGLPFSSVG